MNRIVISESMEAAALEEFPPEIDYLYDPTLVERREALLASLGVAEALIVRNRTQVDRALLEAAPSLSVVGRLGVGLDNIDLPACRARGVTVYPASGANKVSVAEYVIAAALQLIRGGAYALGPQMLAGAWPRWGAVGGEIEGRVLGLVGFGDIARSVAVRALALGMRVLAHDPYLDSDDPAWAGAQRSSLKPLLAGADIVSLHVPLTPETRCLIDATALAGMKPGAIVINTARGGVVAEADLAAALRAGRLGGAALDVFEEEPLSAAAAAPFAGLANVILTPHIAGVTAESNARVSRVTVENVLHGLGLLDA